MREGKREGGARRERINGASNGGKLIVEHPDAGHHFPDIMREKP
jgi:hypothetical protein